MTTTPAPAQLTLTLEPTLVDRYPTLREFIAHRVQVQTKPAKTIAAEMDMAPSTLSRKLHPADGDTQRFNVDDLERYLDNTADVSAIIEYLASKYMGGGDEARIMRLVAQGERAAKELAAAVSALKVRS